MCTFYGVVNYNTGDKPECHFNLNVSVTFHECPTTQNLTPTLLFVPFNCCTVRLNH